VINIKPTKPISGPIYRFELIPHFSERRLLLFVGDLLVVLLAGGGAVWLHSIMK